MQTLEPLADRLGLPVETDDRLAEGAGGDQALALADELRKERTAAVVCSHGDVIPDLLRILKADDHPLPATRSCGPRGRPGCVTRDGDRWSKARYIRPGRRHGARPGGAVPLGSGRSSGRRRRRQRLDLRRAGRRP